MLNPQLKENADLLYEAGVFRYEPYSFAYEAKHKYGGNKASTCS